MGNFEFIAAWEDIHADCARAESYVGTDPTGACVYARRAIELLVRRLYFVHRFEEPYKSDLSAHINDPQMSIVPRPVIDKLNLIRRYGNTAAHETRSMRTSESSAALQELFHVMVWAALHLGLDRSSIPVGKRFDPILASKSAPLPRAQVGQIVAQFKARDAEMARRLEDSENAKAELAKQLAEAQAALAAAKELAPATALHDLDEAETRQRLIDQDLREVGWLLDNPRDREFEVHGLPTPTGKGYVDYVLWGSDARPLALIEAKRTSRMTADAQHQASLYADALEKQFGRRPVIFMTNGYEHKVWDDASGYPPRHVHGFFTADELELMIQRRTTRRPLSAEPIDADIAGRYYQNRAIRAIDNAFDSRRRDALLVMATGSGKTRTAAALAKQLMDANWAKRVLFLADRTALVRQSARAFREHLGSVTTVNLVEERNAEGRVYVSTYPTMLNLINQVDDDARRFGPGYFDLIIVDEAHRSVYQKYKAIFDYFDAMLVGLTATPKDEVDHNTYRLFHLEDGMPTDAYGLDEAVKDGFLVPYKAVSAGTAFTRTGIRYDELGEDDKHAWDELDWGEDGPPDEVDSGELNQHLFNASTVDLVLGKLMSEGYRVNAGEDLGKTIIFAKNQAHADFILQRFNIGWPEHAGKTAAVITHGTSHAESLIDKFSSANENPRIAISVDMLDTGIDVPEVLNLVFFKPVMSKSKFWQMIGRGTRLCPDIFDPGEHKQDFLVFDCCGNFDYFGQGLPGTEGRLQTSVSQRLFEQRLALVQALDSSGHSPGLRTDLVKQLHATVAGINGDNVLVRPHRRALEKFRDPEAWKSLSAQDVLEVAELAGLPTSIADGDDKAKRFDLLITRGQLALLSGEPALLQTVSRALQESAELLFEMRNIPVVAANAELLERMRTDEFWQHISLEELEQIRLRLRGLLMLVEPKRRPKVYTDFEDHLLPESVVGPGLVTPGFNQSRFEERARAELRKYNNISLERLKRGQPLTQMDLDEFGRILVGLGASESEVAQLAETHGGLGLFIRRMIGLDREAVMAEFAALLDEQHYNERQIRFIQMIIDELCTNGVMDPGRLFEMPYTDNAPTGPTALFTPDEVKDIAGIMRRLSDSALPEAG